MISDATLQLMMPYLGYLEAEGLPKIDPLVMERYGPVISKYLVTGENENKWTQSSSLHKSPEKIAPEHHINLFFNPFFFSEGLIQWILQKPEDQITKNLIWSKLGYAITKKTTSEIFQEIQGEILKISKALELANKWANRNYMRQAPRRDTGVNFDCEINDYEYGDCRYTSRRESWSVNVSRGLIDEIKALSEGDDADLDDARQQGIDMLQEYFKECHQDSADSYGDYDYDNHDATDYEDFEDQTNYETIYDQILDS